jgi:hypothetical protein
MLLLKYCLTESILTIGPITIAEIKTTKAKAGMILKNLAVINLNGFLLCIKLLVTTNPLIKKNIFTAQGPEAEKEKK